MQEIENSKPSKELLVALKKVCKIMNNSDKYKGYNDIDELKKHYYRMIKYCFNKIYNIYFDNDKKNENLKYYFRSINLWVKNGLIVL